MNSEAQQQIQGKFQELPSDIQSFLTSQTYVSGLERIVNSFQLTSAEASALEMETSLLILGLSSPQDLISNLDETIKRAPKELGTILTAIDTLISPIQTSLIRFVHKENQLAAESEMSPDIKPTPQREEHSFRKEKPLLDHLEQFEKRKQERDEQEQQTKGTGNTSPKSAAQQHRQVDSVPANLPVATEDKVKTEPPHPAPTRSQEKTRPAGPDPYREPIE